MSEMSEYPEYLLNVATSGFEDGGKTMVRLSINDSEFVMHGGDARNLGQALLQYADDDGDDGDDGDNGVEVEL